VENPIRSNFPITVFCCFSFYNNESGQDSTFIRYLCTIFHTSFLIFSKGLGAERIVTFLPERTIVRLLFSLVLFIIFCYTALPLNAVFPFFRYFTIVETWHAASLRFYQNTCLSFSYVKIRSSTPFVWFRNRNKALVGAFSYTK